jgi:hypothetical protein
MDGRRYLMDRLVKPNNLIHDIQQSKIILILVIDKIYPLCSAALCSKNKQLHGSVAERDLPDPI